MLTVLIGCSTEEQPTSPPPPATSAEMATTLTPELDHLHALHIRADGTILAGTHTGVVALTADGTTSRVGVSDDDFMGLTGVTGSDRLFASGHPGPTSSAPNPLGLVASENGGQTWTPRSVAGDIDFHALATNGQLLVGFDGINGLLVSTDDGTSWSPGAPLAAAALAITDRGVWATTPAGLQHSADDAQTFTTVPGAPALALLAAAPDGTLWGIDTADTVWRSPDGTHWEQRSTIGTVTALVARNAETAYAANAQSLYTLS
ncbi:F510_1955 family glycosylhydrolase [Gordonia sp. AC31]|uniref:F510_1955 family glycosylhydrolase n=1 Tax=Gordonia sp. AC31 TaxID=2962571 RepID=UPI0037BE8C2D